MSSERFRPPPLSRPPAIHSPKRRAPSLAYPWDCRGAGVGAAAFRMSVSAMEVIESARRSETLSVAKPRPRWSARRAFFSPQPSPHIVGASPLAIVVGRIWFALGLSLELTVEQFVTALENSPASPAPWLTAPRPARSNGQTIRSCATGGCRPIPALNYLCRRGRSRTSRAKASSSSLERPLFRVFALN